MIKKGITLMEILIVIIIIGILAALGLPGYAKLKEKTMDKEATANLKLIVAAEKIYRMETGGFYPSSGTISQTGSINDILKLSITNKTWDYNLTYSSTSSGTPRVCATAGRTDTSVSPQVYKTWHLATTDVDMEPANGTACP